MTDTAVEPGTALGKVFAEAMDNLGAIVARLINNAADAVDQAGMPTLTDSPLTPRAGARQSTAGLGSWSGRGS